MAFKKALGIRPSESVEKEVTKKDFKGNTSNKSLFIKKKK